MAAIQARSETAPRKESGTNSVPKRTLEVKERGLAVALQVDVEAKAAVLLASDERRAPLGLDREQHRVRLVGLWLVRKVDARDDALQQTAREDRDVDVWRLHPPVEVRDRAWLDRHEPVFARGVGTATPEAAEAGLEGRPCARVCRMVVAPVPVGLPDLDQGVVDRFAAAVENRAEHLNRLRVVGRHELAAAIIGQADAEERADCLGRRGEHW